MIKKLIIIIIISVGIFGFISYQLLTGGHQQDRLDNIRFGDSQ